MKPLLGAIVLALFPGVQEGPDREAIQTSIDRGVAFLLKDQNPDGSWGGYDEPRGRENWGWSNIGTHHGWTAATTGIVCVALLDLGTDAKPEALAALDRGLDYLIAKGRPRRVSNWDVDNVWGYVYGLEAVVRALGDSRVRNSSRREPLEALGKDLLKLLDVHQTPGGGWAYYDDPPFMRKPSWATSFVTGATILILLEAEKVGLQVDEKMLTAATRALKRCRLPDGAYTYDVAAIPRARGLESINRIKGSLSRIQVGNLALLRTDQGLDENDLRQGLDLFFRHHKFLAVGRGRPIPHEAYYAVAGYFFFFGHYYAAGVIEALPRGEREPYWAKLREKVMETQEKDGSMWDFHSHRYHRPYGTAWSVSILKRSLAPPPRQERL